MFKILRSFHTKITATLILLMIFSGALGNFLIYEYSLKSQMGQLRDKLKIVAQAIAMTVDPGEVLAIPLNKKGEDTAEFRAVEKKLLKIRDLSPSIVYIYILRKTDKENILQFAIDIHPSNRAAENLPASPGEKYDISHFPELQKAFEQSSADKVFGKDKWGIFLSGYAPIRNSLSNVIAVLGVDVSAEDVYSMQNEVHKRAILVLLLGVILSLIIGVLISGAFAKPIEELLKGTRHIAAGNLDYRVDVKGSDEFKELADSFNQMAFKLDKARKEISNYFYRVAQSLVRVLEARDPYTKGHSDRVAEYAEKVALKIGLPPEKMEILKEAALLHDIGKMGIREIILEKKTELSPADRTTIEKHPLIGESILKPVSSDRELLAAVRGHHEHYDGTGYPDRLKGEDINILSAIVSVADAYDAMTTKRAYNTVLTKEEAIAEIKKKSGIQFNPRVVEALIEALG